MSKNIRQSIAWLLNEKYGGRITDKAKKDIERLRAGEPVDYVIGYKNFCGCKIDLRYRPLIPREETEFWVSKVIAEAGSKPDIGADPDVGLLDIFAGSGCCGIALLKHIPSAKCDFTDIDPRMLRQIRLNLRENGISAERYRVFQSDIFSKIGKNNKKYDLILANPPYIAFSDKNKTQASVLGYEPQKALFAKNKGLYFIEKFLKQAKEHLAPRGVIYLEFGYNQKKYIEKLLKKYDYQNFEFCRDQFSKWRCLEIKN